MQFWRDLNHLTARSFCANPQMHCGTLYEVQDSNTNKSENSHDDFFQGK